MLYNVPGRTGCSLAPETTARLLDLTNVVAYKAASGSTEEVSRLVALCHLHGVPVVAFGAGTSLEDQAWAESAEGGAMFAAEPVVVEVIAQTASGFLTGAAATYGPQEWTLSGSRRLIEERAAGPEPTLAAAAALPEPGPCY
jgi:4-hydroxy-tetrahydrodipicolinate synthase